MEKFNLDDFKILTDQELAEVSGGSRGSYNAGHGFATAVKKVGVIVGVGGSAAVGWAWSNREEIVGFLESVW